jgi:hypothetical protein
MTLGCCRSGCTPFAVVLAKHSVWLAALTSTGGCFPSFDHLTGEEQPDAAPAEAACGDQCAVSEKQPDAAPAEAACGDQCAVSEPEDCVDSTVYPGGGLHKMDFSNVSDMKLNPAAKVTNGILQVSVDNNSQGSAFISAPFAFDARTSIFAHFRLRIGGGAGLNGSDGLAFIMQNSSDGANAIGIGGGGLGYQNIKPSVAVEFDTFLNPGPDPDGNHVAMLSDGDVSIHIAHASPSFQLKDGVTRDVWIDYDWAADLLEVYMSADSTRPATPMLAHAAQSYLAALGNHVYVGVSAASGGMSNQHEIHGEMWVVTSPLRKCR